MVGQALREIMPEAAYFSEKQVDLRDRAAVFKLFEGSRPQCVIHLAAMVGGVKANSQALADFYSNNIQINTNVLDAAASAHVSKLVSLLSTCVYPADCGLPLRETDIHCGEPHASNFGYAYAKRMLDVHSRALRLQYGCNFITIVPNNLFGQNDDFSLTRSHVVPAIIRKMFEAKRDGRVVSLWGDGSVLREFTYVHDLAKIIKFVLANYDDPMPLNVGCTREFTVAEVASLVAEYVGYHGSIYWDTSELSGQYRKSSDTSRFESLGWRHEWFTPFEVALRSTCDWFVGNYPRVRGVLQ